MFIKVVLLIVVIVFLLMLDGYNYQLYHNLIRSLPKITVEELEDKADSFDIIVEKRHTIPNYLINIYQRGTWSHTAMIILVNGKKYVIEYQANMKEKGLYINAIEDWYKDNGTHDHILMKYTGPKPPQEETNLILEQFKPKKIFPQGKILTLLGFQKNSRYYGFHCSEFICEFFSKNQIDVSNNKDCVHCLPHNLFQDKHFGDRFYIKKQPSSRLFGLITA